MSILAPHCAPGRHRARDQRGASAVEYAILVGLIAIVIIAGVTFFGGATNGLFQRSCTSVAASTQSGGC